VLRRAASRTEVQERLLLVLVLVARPVVVWSRWLRWHLCEMARNHPGLAVSVSNVRGG
jgi:hypothetical protein